MTDDDTDAHDGFIVHETDGPRGRYTHAICPECDGTPHYRGSGHIDDTAVHAYCPECDRSGWVEITHD